MEPNPYKHVDAPGFYKIKFNGFAAQSIWINTPATGLWQGDAWTEGMVLPILLPLLIVVHTSVQPRVGQPQKNNQNVALRRGSVTGWFCSIAIAFWTHCSQTKKVCGTLLEMAIEFRANKITRKYRDYSDLDGVIFLMLNCCTQTQRQWKWMKLLRWYRLTHVMQEPQRYLSAFDFIHCIVQFVFPHRECRTCARGTSDATGTISHNIISLRKRISNDSCCFCVNIFGLAGRKSLGKLGHQSKHARAKKLGKKGFATHQTALKKIICVHHRWTHRIRPQEPMKT